MGSSEQTREQNLPSCVCQKASACPRWQSCPSRVQGYTEGQKAQQEDIRRLAVESRGSGMVEESEEKMSELTKNKKTPYELRVVEDCERWLSSKDQYEYGMGSKLLSEIPCCRIRGNHCCACIALPEYFITYREGTESADKLESGMTHNEILGVPEKGCPDGYVWTPLRWENEPAHKGKILNLVRSEVECMPPLIRSAFLDLEPDLEHTLPQG